MTKIDTRLKYINITVKFKTYKGFSTNIVNTSFSNRNSTGNKEVKDVLLETLNILRVIVRNEGCYEESLEVFTKPIHEDSYEKSNL